MKMEKAMTIEQTNDILKTMALLVLYGLTIIFIVTVLIKVICC